MEDKGLAAHEKVVNQHKGWRLEGHGDGAAVWTHPKRGYVRAAHGEGWQHYKNDDDYADERPHKTGRDPKSLKAHLSTLGD